MSTDARPPGPTGPIAQPKRPPGVAFWLGLAVFMAGIVMGVLGVRAAVVSYQREQDLKSYAEASTKARYAASVGAEAVATGQQFLALNQSDATAAPELRQLIVAGNSSKFNSRREDLNRESTQQADLSNNLVALGLELRRALALTGAIKPRSTTPSSSP